MKLKIEFGLGIIVQQQNNLIHLDYNRQTVE